MNRTWMKAAPVLLGLTVLVGTQNSFAGYSIMDLGTLGGSSSYAYSVNSRGFVVGWSLTSDRRKHAFLWHDGVMSDIGALIGPGTSEALDVNQHGQVVGNASVEGFGGAFVYEDGVVTMLPTLGASWNYATGISDNGDVVGTSASSDGDWGHACLWRNGKVIDLGTLNTEFGVTFTALNSRGEIVASDLCGDCRAVLWRRGSITDLGSLGGGSSFAYDINDAGAVVGYSSTPTHGTHGFVWRDGAMADLGDLAGDNRHYSAAHAVNNRGQIVGRSYNATDAYAVLWEEGAGAIINLGTLEGSASSGAWGINERGWIAGASGSREAVAGSADDPVHAVLWVPTSTSTPVASLSGPTSVASSPKTPAVVSRRSNSTVSLSFVAPHAGNVTLRLFDVSGRLMREIWGARSVTAGRNEVLIDGSAASGTALPSSVYFYRAEMQDWSLSGKILITR